MFAVLRIALEKLSLAEALFASLSVPNPHQVSKVRSLWRIEQCDVREVGKLDSKLREKDWLCRLPVLAPGPHGPGAGIWTWPRLGLTKRAGYSKPVAAS